MTPRIDISVPANGRLQRATVRLYNGDQLLTTDQANVLDMTQRKKLADRLSPLVQDTRAEDLHALIEKAVMQALAARDVEEARRAREQAEAEAVAAGGPEDVDARAERLLLDLPAAIREEAEKLLRDPDLIDTVAGHIQALGLAGEQKPALLIYLTGTSRLLRRPLATRVKGASASGKSFTADTVAELFPPEAIVRATTMTPQALYHLRPGALRHVWVAAGERSRSQQDEVAEATRALREMISAGRLSKLMPVKTGNTLETVLIEQDGQIFFTESTTLNTVFDEDENRCLSVFTDERPEQTRRILDRLGADHAGAAQPGARDMVVAVHHALQRLLRRREVVIPYAARLAGLIPAKRVEARRAFPHLLSTIQASALLHQYQRLADDQGRLLATREDYRVAALLLKEPLQRLLGGRPLRRGGAFPLPAVNLVRPDDLYHD